MADNFDCKNYFYRRLLFFTDLYETISSDFIFFIQFNRDIFILIILILAIQIQSEEQESILINIDEDNHKDIYKYLIIIILISTASISYITLSHRSSLVNIHNVNVSYSEINENSSRVLVIYVFANSHLISLSNLEYFIRVAVHKSTNVDYYIILQQLNNIYVNETNLPKLPSYAHYIQHENKCFDLGTIGWFLSNGKINLNNYKYFIFLNSSVRGPYLVSYYGNKEWYYAFTERLNNYTKLVGSTISCENNPHVQSYFWVTDIKGLSLLKNANIFACHKNHIDAIYNGELRASQVILSASYGIDSMMKKYQGIDFRQKQNKDCNHRINPSADNRVDGISLDPFEVIFIKFKYSPTDYRNVQSRISAYDKWI